MFEALNQAIQDAPTALEATTRRAVRHLSRIGGHQNPDRSIDDRIEVGAQTSGYPLLGQLRDRAGIEGGADQVRRPIRCRHGLIGIQNRFPELFLRGRTTFSKDGIRTRLGEQDLAAAWVSELKSSAARIPAASLARSLGSPNIALPRVRTSLVTTTS